MEIKQIFSDDSLSQKTIDYGKNCSWKAGITFAKKLNIMEIYIVSDHVNLYEKYCFRKIDEKMAHWGKMQSIFKRAL